jgi:hypothetical protein
MLPGIEQNLYFCLSPAKIMGFASGERAFQGHLKL